LSPLFGYWIQMNASKTLVYPSGGYLLGKTERTEMVPSVANNPSLPQACDFWAYQPGVFQVGDSIRVMDRNGVVCGDTVVTTAGAFLVHVSGDDPTTATEDEGAVPGEVLRFRVNRDSATVLGCSVNYDSAVVAGNPAIWEAMGSKKVRLAVVRTGAGRLHDIPGSVLPEPSRFLRNYPNPFNAQTLVHYRLDRQGGVVLRVIDSRGRVVRFLVRNRMQGPGFYTAVWNGENEAGRRVPSGIYFSVLEAGGVRMVSKMVLAY